MAAAGDTAVKEDLLKGRKVGNMTYKVHLDGYNLLPAFKGEGQWPRKEFLYWTDDGNVAALRYGNWKATFLRQDAHGMKVWQEPFVTLRAPMLTNLRMGPFELAADIGMDYERWFAEHMFMIAPAASYVGQWLQSFREFPPRQKPGSFNLDNVMEAVMSGAAHKGANCRRARHYEYTVSPAKAGVRNRLNTGFRLSPIGVNLSRLCCVWTEVPLFKRGI
jgi:arylsulfatase